MANFGYELNNDLIPAIDAKYSTYASREHRALGGASRGGLLVWGAMPVALSEVAHFAPICNGCVHTIYPDEQEAEADRLCDAMSTPENAQYDISYLFTFAGDCDTNKLRVYSTYDEVLRKNAGPSCMGREHLLRQAPVRHAFQQVLLPRRIRKYAVVLQGCGIAGVPVHPVPHCICVQTNISRRKNQ